MGKTLRKERDQRDDRSRKPNMTKYRSSRQQNKVSLRKVYGF